MAKTAEIKKKLGKTDWYQQGGAMKPVYISYPISSCSWASVFGRRIPEKYELLVYYKDHRLMDYISKRSLEKMALLYYNKQRRSSGFLEKLYSAWMRKQVARLLKMKRDVFGKKLAELSDKELAGLFREFNKTYLDFWHEAIFLDSFDYYGEIIKNEMIRKENKMINSEEVEKLLSPPRASFLQKERIDLANLAEKIMRRKDLKKTLIRQKNWLETAKKFPVLRKKLSEHAKKYHWLRNDYASVEYLDEEYFYKNLRALLRDKKALKEERRMIRTLKRLSAEKRKILEKRKLSKTFASVSTFLAFLGNFRDARKSYNQMGSSVVEKFVLEFSRRTKLDKKDIEEMFWWELGNIFRSGEKVLRNVKKRSGEAFFISQKQTKILTFTGRDAKALNEFFCSLIRKRNGLKGMPAYRGIVRGVVKIVKDKKDFPKMKKGNILVAPNTRPEYISVMKLAGAVVSDEGGLTSHAAIVSRELKIPAVVGVQGATSILKDGEKVEVDASRGTIKRIR